MRVIFALALVLLVSRGIAEAGGYGAGSIAMRDGYPIFTVRGEPFFIWGAAFFYERIPRERWRDALERLRALEVNTIDLYVPWNWHEPAEGAYDFTGATDSRRDLRGLLRLVRSMGFYVIVRPGPVIRNEWRNGGYPAWLLERPEYGMPLHDVLEGRYPATATLQNARSDDAAAEWMRNRTHLRFTERWLRRALAEFAPVADRVLAIQLDDDQGAYLTNQTWPAPHLRAYLHWLAATVHAATSPRVPVFINTYQMKVTASSPVWAMGNWYQSDVRSIGEHDRAQLAFSTALLGTRPRQPIVLSEFQAGWLLVPEDIYPRAADPTNTELALHTALDAGARGAIDFPMQDTLAPAGWEAPFANWFYAWDAALTVDGRPAARFGPTERFGRLVAAYGRQLAATHLVADAAIAWWPSALDTNAAPLSDDEVGSLADATIAAQRDCRRHEMTCALVDLRFASEGELRRYPALIVPQLAPALTAPQRLAEVVRERMARFARRGRLLHSLDEPAARGVVAARAVRGLAGATLHAGASAVFLDVVNFSNAKLTGTARVRYAGKSWTHFVDVPARSAALARLDRADATGAPAVTARNAAPPHDGVPIRRGLLVDAAQLEGLTLEDRETRVIVSPRAGARAFLFEDRAHHTNAFSTVGALRDDVALQPPPSQTDRIAKYTHSFPAGTFNRAYRVTSRGPRTVALTYAAPDVVPHGATFTKSLRLEGSVLIVREGLAARNAPSQRLVVRSSLALGRTGTTPWRAPLLLPQGVPLAARRSYPLDPGLPLALYDTGTHEYVAVGWARGAVEEAHLDVEDRHAVVRLRYAPGVQTTCYEYVYFKGEAEARARLRSWTSESDRTGGVAERSTQSPQKRPGESPSGFKSHLPHT